MRRAEGKRHVDTIQFKNDPAWVTVGEGVSLAFGHWPRTWWLWGIPVLAIGLLASGLYGIVFRTVEAGVPPDLFGPANEFDIAAFLGWIFQQTVLIVVVLTIAGTVARWTYLAAAILGLRGTELTIGWLIGRGLRVLAGDLLLMVVWVAGLLALVGIVTVAGAGLSVLLVAALGIPVLWVSVRLAFWPLVVFDGSGFVEALRTSWSLSGGAWWRMLGWGFVYGLMDMGLRLVLRIVLTPLGDDSAVRAGIEAGATEAAAAFGIILLAILYESQRRLPMAMAQKASARQPAWTGGWSGTEPPPPPASAGSPIAPGPAAEPGHEPAEPPLIPPPPPPAHDAGRG